jgi:hypothetical protein
VLSEHTAVTARTWRIADLKVAADKNAFSDRYQKRPAGKIFKVRRFSND